MLVRTRKEKNMSHRGEPARKKDPKSPRRKRPNPVPVLGIAMILLLVAIAFVLFYYR